MYRILYVDDDIGTLAIRRNFLEEKGCLVDVCTNGIEAMNFATKKSYDVILLDVLLKETTGFTLCGKIQSVNSAPIIFLSTLTDESSQLQGFDAGGIDYITKTCTLELFWKKINTRIATSKMSNQETLLKFPPLTIDIKHRKVYIKDTLLSLTNTEYDLLCLMAAKPGYLWQLKELYTSVWDYETEDYASTVQPHISRLRRKLEKAFPNHYFIETVWGKGYYFSPSEEFTSS